MFKHSQSMLSVHDHHVLLTLPMLDRFQTSGSPAKIMWYKNLFKPLIAFLHLHEDNNVITIIIMHTYTSYLPFF